MDIDPTAVEDLFAFISGSGSDNNNNNNSSARDKGRNMSEKLMKVSDAVLDSAMRLQVMGLDESQSRRLMLKEMLKRSKLSPQKGGYAGTSTRFSDSLKLVGITLAIKKTLFSKEATDRRRRRIGGGGEEEEEKGTAAAAAAAEHGRNRWDGRRIM